MVYVLTRTITPRLIYIQDIIGELLGVPLSFFTQKEALPPTQPWINYTSHPELGGMHIPPTDLLFEQGVQHQSLNIYWETYPLLFGAPTENPHALDFDVFAAIFYLVTDYEKYVVFRPDRHDRYDQTAYPSAQWKLQEVPLVHFYVEKLWKKLKQVFPHHIFSRSLPTATGELTFDLDYPWKHRHKPLSVMLGGGIKDLAQGKISNVRERWKAVIQGKDPFYTFDLLLDHSKKDHTHFFFLIDHHAPEDSRFSYKQQVLRALIQKIVGEGYRSGIHPSFISYTRPDILRHEVQRLTELIERPVLSSRQHFLRHRLPDTYRYLLAEGIQEEYTPCLYTSGGFPNGMAQPFYWYDLLREEKTVLRLHPTMIMDRTLHTYMKLNPVLAYQRFAELKRTTESYRGKFTLLLHNDTLSDSGEWTGWLDTILRMMDEVQKMPSFKR
ncbi:MAG: hypothetical protein AAFR59_04895 [Bacteroidota bacterium]